MIQFDNGADLSQALLGGSVDIGVAGSGLLANFAPQQDGVVVLPVFVEADSVQMYAHPDSGITSPDGLSGQQVALTVGTTSHLLLSLALSEAGTDLDDVEVVNMSAADAASGLISGAVPAAAMWVPHTSNVKERVPEATLVTSLQDFYPEQAMLGGFVTRRDFFESDHDALVALAAAVLEANDMMIDDPDQHLEAVWQEAYSEQESFEAFMSNWESIRFLTAAEWREAIDSGQLEDWLTKMQEGMVTIGALDEARELDQFFDASVLEDAIARYEEAS